MRTSFCREAINSSLVRTIGLILSNFQYLEQVAVVVGPGPQVRPDERGLYAGRLEGRGAKDGCIGRQQPPVTVGIIVFIFVLVVDVEGGFAKIASVPRYHGNQVEIAI